MEPSSFYKIIFASLPGFSNVIQYFAELESEEIERRLRVLEDPLGQFDSGAKDLCVKLYDAVKSCESVSAKIPWSDCFEPFLKTLRRFEAHGMISGTPVLGDTNAYRHGIWLKPRFLVYIAMLGGDEPWCRDLADLMSQLDSGNSLDGKKVAQSIKLPLPVIDAYFHLFESEGQGMKSREIGRSYYISH